MLPVLYLIVPCYNEESVLPIMAPVFLKKLTDLITASIIDDASRILFVNDGSKDGTWGVICDLSKEENHFCGISQSRNRGHQNALLAGLTEASERCDVTVTIDCDGQDDINAIDRMLAEYADGCDVVYGVRSDRKSDSAFKRSTAQCYYRFLNSMGGESVYNHADYRLISSRALKELLKFEEMNLYLRGMVPLVGFRSTTVEYVRTERKAGKTHYSLKKMLNLASDGITGFSVKPLRAVLTFGTAASVLGFLVLIWTIVSAIIGTENGINVWMALLLFLGGVQLLSIGILGEYIGKINLEVRHRPRYIISDRTDNTQNMKED